MIPPTSIDGTDITGATIDGTDVTEITVDGDTVFTAGPTVEPVAYSNLIAWYPFDSATYGGGNADDVSALFNPGNSGDSTAYDGSVTGATYQSSGGVTDINAGTNSGAFDFNAAGDRIDIGTPTPTVNVSELSWSFWYKVDPNSPNTNVFGAYPNTNSGFRAQTNPSPATFIMGVERNGNAGFVFFDESPLGVYHHAVCTFNNGSINAYFDGVLQGTATGPSTTPSETWFVGDDLQNNAFDATVDDCRIYNKELTASEVNDMYQNTQP